MNGRATSETRYARAIERRWSRLLGRPVVLSPRDWKVLTGWYSRRIPLGLVEECMEDVCQRKRARRLPASLAALGPAVEEAWAVVVDGRVTARERQVSPEEAHASDVAAWRGRAAEEPADSPLRPSLERWAERVERGADPIELAAEVDRELAESLAPELLREIDAELERELGPFRSRIAAADLEGARSRARLDRMRRRLRLPRPDRLS